MATLKFDHQCNDNSDTQTHIDDLDNNLLELILKRLYLQEDLAKFIYVSKRWNSIVCNLDFFQNLTHESFFFTLFYTRHGASDDDHGLVTEHLYFQRHKFRIDFIPYYNDLIASHNELLITFRRPSLSDHEAAYHISNPLTKQSITIRPIPMSLNDIPKPLNDNHLVSEGVAYYRRCLIGLAGFVKGINTGTNFCNNYQGFRLVRVHRSYEDYNVLVVQIYSSETGKWETHTTRCCRAPEFKKSAFATVAIDVAVTYNNKLHWLGLSEILVIDAFADVDVVAPHLLVLPREIRYRPSYDHPFPKPNTYHTRKDRVLGVCRNRLRITQIAAEDVRDYYGPRSIQVWEFSDYDGSASYFDNNFDMGTMTLVASLPLNTAILDTFFTYPIICGIYYDVICCHPHNPYVVYFVYRRKLFRCDLNSSRFTLCGDYSNEDNDFVFLHPLIALV